jgi:hypothetical protein
MTKDDYIQAAIDTVMALAESVGVSYAADDFSRHDCRSQRHLEEGKVLWKTLPYGEDAPAMEASQSAVKVFLDYDFARNGAALKKNRDRFLDFYNAAVNRYHVVFTFSLEELRHAHESASGGCDPDDKGGLIRKIAALLDKSEEGSGATEHEAVAAAMMAQKLLAKYNISMEEVKGEAGLAGEHMREVRYYTQPGGKFKRLLAYTVADSCQCKMYYIGRDGIVFFGRESAALAARRVFSYLYKVGNRLGRKEANDQRALYGTAMGVFESYTRGFCMGVKSVLQKSCRALQLVVPPEVEDAFTELTEGFSTARQIKFTISDASAFEKGNKDGMIAINASFVDSPDGSGQLGTGGQDEGE